MSPKMRRRVLRNWTYRPHGRVLYFDHTHQGGPPPRGGVSSVIANNQKGAAPTAALTPPGAPTGGAREERPRENFGTSALLENKDSSLTASKPNSFHFFPQWILSTPEASCVDHPRCLLMLSYAWVPIFPGVLMDSQHRGGIVYTPTGGSLDRGIFTHTCLHDHSEGRCRAMCLCTFGFTAPTPTLLGVGVLEGALLPSGVHWQHQGLVLFPGRACVLIMSWDMSWHTIHQCGDISGRACVPIIPLNAS
ncbi:hypothetical protein PAPYR_5461 [Paratrimastix pyriformis]|uniref:Uncharacterized protein n=1 Tax=Paratrimastix pyriformis TaxID=342808 RepID=A0ABQ8UHI7_9EUKA|nr:hypothetical protein PAPYR_5461 [Paratrimastix pyriformis]